MIYEAEHKFDGDNCSVTGIAVFDCEVENELNSDVGGIDGLQVTTCEFVKVKLDGYAITRTGIEAIIGRVELIRLESDMGAKAEEELREG